MSTPPDQTALLKELFSFLKVVVGRLRNPLLIFALAVIVVLAFVGRWVDERFQVLIWIVAVVPLVTYLAIEVIGQLRRTGRPRSGSGQRSEYVRQLVSDYNKLRLGGLDPQDADATRPRSMTLDHVYVSLDTLSIDSETEGTEAEAKKQRFESSLEFGEPRRLSAVKALWTARERRAVLLGLPGSGKSTFVRHLALKMAQAMEQPSFDFKSEIPGWGGGALLPVVLPLGLFAESLPVDTEQGGADQVEGFLHSEIDRRKGLEGFGSAILSELEERGGLVLFDGLDEVASLERRPLVRQSVEDFAGRYPKCHILVTCRTYSYTDPDWELAGWPSHELAPLKADDIERFVGAWYQELSYLDPARVDDYSLKRKRLVEALSPGEWRQLAKIATNPLLLTVMAVVHTHHGELPDARAKVYHEAVALLLIRWRPVSATKARRTIVEALEVPEIQLVTALQEVAYRAHGADEAASREHGLVTEDVLRGILGVRFRDGPKVDTFLDYCQSSNGLLMLQGVAPLPDVAPDSPPVGVYAFPHLSFQEYLAACHLSELENLGEVVRNHLGRGDRWREVLLFLGEHLCFQRGAFERMEGVLRRLVTEAWVEGDAQAVWLAGDLLVLLRRAVTVGDKGLEERVLARLVDLLESSALTPRERAAAGRTLSALGDPRPGVGVIASGRGSGLPDLTWVEVPGGTLRMGSGREDRFTTPEGQEEPYPDEIGPGGEPFAVAIGSFRIAAYPVTVAQFRPFVERGGYEEAGHWTQAGWAWREKNGVTVPREWEDRTWHLDNHPVTYVSWFEAVAYCRWVTARWRESGLLGEGEVIRLPTEAEWEWVARGPEGSRWPWGEEWQEGRCDSSEAGIGRTSAVGLFPGGAGWLTGVQDLSGNVWEWCSTRWVEDYQADWQERSGRDEWSRVYLKEDEIRSLRGGSYLYSARLVRGASRYWDGPGGWGWYRGFRCARCLSRSEY